MRVIRLSTRLNLVHPGVTKLTPISKLISTKYLTSRLLTTTNRCFEANEKGSIRKTKIEVEDKVEGEEVGEDTFDLQASLPRLPVPELNQTIQLYLSSLKPLYPNEFTEIENLAKEFVSENGQGQVLQKRLVEYETKQKSSWLEDIWLNKAYLEYREPTLLNVNWWCQFEDFKPLKLDQVQENAVTQNQIQRASGLLSTLLDFNDTLNREALKPEFVKGIPMCMDQYKCQFGTTRIPLPKCDRIDSSFPCLAYHIVVSYKNQLVKVPVYTSKGKRVPVATLRQQLQDVVDKVDKLTPEQLQVPIGVFTGAHRDVWAQARADLEQHESNKTNFSIIDRALIVLCLDAKPAGADSDKSHHIFFHNYDGSNRWFDKAIQLIVTSDAKAGINGEHTPADAVIPGRIMEQMVSSEPAKDPENLDSNAKLEPVELLQFTVDPPINQALEQARTDTKNFISTIQSVLLHYNSYGSDQIKSFKISPDSYLQMALQLAYYRLHKQVPPTYETSSTRAFLHGRTETCRSCSEESTKFVHLFDQPDVTKETKIEALKTAVAAHKDYMKKASAGAGVDRHLLGLRVMLQPDESAPPLLAHPSYSGSMTFKLSTSNMSPGNHFYGGFAPVVKDGYGVNYAIGKSRIRLSVSKWVDGKDTDHLKFREVISKAFDDLQQLFK